MKTIALINEKGGVYKTTLATTIAAGFAIRGSRVVLIDADPQANATLSLGLKEAPGLYDLLIRDAEFEDVTHTAVPAVYGHQVAGELYVIPSNVETRGIPIMKPNPLLIHERLQELEGWADLVVFDTAPTPSLIHAAIYLAADGIIFPTNCTHLSLDGLAKSILHKDSAQSQRSAEGMGEIKTMGIVPTGYRSQTTAHDIGIQQLVQEFKRLVWPAMPMRTIWEQASWAGESIFRFAPDDVAATEAWALVDRVAATLPEKAHVQ